MSLTNRGRFIASNNVASLVITELGMYKLLLMLLLNGDLFQHIVDSTDSPPSSTQTTDFKDIAINNISDFLESIILRINLLSTEINSPPIAFTYDSFMTLFTSSTAFLKNLQEPKSLFSALSIGNSSGESSIRKDSHTQHKNTEQLIKVVQKLHFERQHCSGIRKLLTSFAEGAVHNYSNVILQFTYLFVLKDFLT